MNLQNLLPCPFCGCKDIDDEDCSNMQTNGTRLVCNGCGASVEGYGGSTCTARAISAWNTRADATDLRARLEAAERVLRYCRKHKETMGFMPDPDAYWAGLGDANRVKAERDAAIARAKKAEKERDSYRSAKGENDDRFMLERDEARAQRDRLAALLRLVIPHIPATAIDAEKFYTRPVCECYLRDNAIAALAEIGGHWTCHDIGCAISVHEPNGCTGVECTCGLDGGAK